MNQSYNRRSTEMTLTTRRGFLGQVSGATVAVFAANCPLLAASEREPHISFPTAPRDRISVASYPFRAYIEAPGNRDRDAKLPGMDLKNFAAEVAKKFNVHNVEPLSRHFSSLGAEYLAGFRQALKQAGSKAVNIAVDNDHSFYDRELPARKQAIAYAKKFIDVAIQIGSPSVRLHIRGAKNSQPDVQRTAGSLREVVTYASGKNVVVNLENDDLVSEDAFFIVKVIEAVNQPFLHALPDFANSMTTGDADFNYRALEAMFHHAYNICHVKSGEAGDGGKQFNIDMNRSFGILKASGYRGYCSMEFDAPGDPYAPTSQLIEQTLHYLS
ncbi:MAG TPA: TIM barrel protein [Terriglobales bacterium]|nr:TIM barrel protein [Terriglobales bacterium]